MWKKHLGQYRKNSLGSNQTPAIEDEGLILTREQSQGHRVRPLDLPAFSEKLSTGAPPESAAPTSTAGQEKKGRGSAKSAPASAVENKAPGLAAGGTPGSAKAGGKDKEGSGPKGPFPGLLKTGREQSLRKVAKFLILLGKEEAVKVVRHLEAREVELIGREIAGIRHVDRAEAQQILKEFGFIAGHIPDSSQGGSEFAKNVLSAAFGEDKAQRYLARAVPESLPRPFAFLRELELPRIQGLLKSESPLVMAVVLPHLPPETGAVFLKSLAPALQKELVQRLAKMEGLSREVVEQIEKKLRSKLEENTDDLDSWEMDGGSALAAMLRHMDLDQEDQILKVLEDSPDLQKRIREQLLTLDSLLRVERRDLADFLRSWEDRDLAYLVKGKSSDITECLLSSLSEGRRFLVEQERSFLGGVPRKDVEEVTRRFMESLRQKLKDGEIRLLDDEDEYLE